MGKVVVEATKEQVSIAADDEETFEEFSELDVAERHLLPVVVDNAASFRSTSHTRIDTVTSVVTMVCLFQSTASVNTIRADDGC